MEQNRIVVRYLNGKVLKGYSQDFMPNKANFHCRPHGAKDGSPPLEVFLKDLKAVFFVRDFVGNRLHKEKKRLDAGEKVQGRLIEVTCRDNEVIVGTTLGYDAARPGFFLFPIDQKANNIKIYIVSSSVAKIRFL
jgi:hypothetical protein